MSETTTTDTQTSTAAPEKSAAVTPAEFLASLPGAPTAEQLDSWKQQAPNNRLRVFTPDGKRAYVLRGITGLELSQIQKQLEGMATQVINPELEVQIYSVIKACVWTNAGTSGKLSDTILRTGSAGLPQSLFQIVSDLSDFFDPQKLDAFSADL